MDLQSKIAARRAELTQQGIEAENAAQAQKAEIERLEAENRRAELDRIAAELSTETTTVTRTADELSLATPTTTAIDVDGLKASAVSRLIATEARKRWTPGENWQFIASMVLGVCLLVPVPGLGVVLVGCAILRRDSLMKRYKAAVKAEHPTLVIEASGSATSAQ